MGIITWYVLRREWKARESGLSRCASGGKDRRWPRGWLELESQKERENKKDPVERRAATSYLCLGGGLEACRIQPRDPDSTLVRRCAEPHECTVIRKRFNGI